MSENCLKCGAVVATSLVECPVCRAPAGFPNVKSASSTDETAALSERYSDAHVSAKARGVMTELLNFEAAIATSKTVMNRSLGALSNWINGESPLFYSFHYQVSYLGRVPTETEWDLGRTAAEATINPFSYQSLNYGALTLDGVGMTYYGPYSITLRSVTLDQRASVFEQNPFLFCKLHHVVAGQPPTLGYRAPWADRDRLAAAKLQPKILHGTNDFATILMDRNRTMSDCDFIEVHIYGPINRLAIERIVGPRPSSRVDLVTWRQLARKAIEYGATVEEAP